MQRTPLKPTLFRPTPPKPAHRSSLLRMVALCWLLAGVTGMSGVSAQASDFPTLDRVVFVQECMRAHPGPGFEMTSKCVCVVDALAAQLSYDDFDTMNTVSKASTIAGERGASLRDAPSVADALQRYRRMQAHAEKGCFITPATR